VTNRWINYVLSVVVVVGLVAVAIYERPRLAEERAAFLDQDIVETDTSSEAGDPDERDPLEWRTRTSPDDADDADDPADSEASEEGSDEPDEPRLGVYGVSAGHEQVVDVGMAVLEAGGNAVDAAVAVAYGLGVAEPFGSGPGGGGMLLLHEPGADPIVYEYRETMPISGELPSARTGVPGFIAGMEHVHDRHGTIELADLIEPAARMAEDGVEVTRTLHERLEGAAHRLPIHLLPELFPDGTPIEEGATLRQPAYAQALRLIQEDGAQVFYEGELGERFTEAVSGLEMEDLQAYEVLELEPSYGRFGPLEVISGPATSSGPTLIQMLQVAEALGIADTERDSAEAHHIIAQAWRVALGDRTEHLADPTFVDVDLEALLSEERTDTLAEAIPADGFAEVEALTDLDGPGSIASNTTHVVIVDAEGRMVSMTNTLRNFFGSGQPISGFFANDQLVNVSSDPDSVNVAEPGKRPRSFLTPTILVEDGEPILGIGSAGGRRIPTAMAQVILGWAVHGQDLEEATLAPRFHLEGSELEVEESLDGSLANELEAKGYEIVETLPTPEYFGSMQALLIRDGQITGVADDRRDGTWDATDP
jgi:gamma-glutamyltranspeptidase / glutathione hydrolase